MRTFSKRSFRGPGKPPLNLGAGRMLRLSYGHRQDPHSQNENRYRPTRDISVNL